MMKRVAWLALAGWLVVLLAGCATTGMEGKSRVKCPSCGYEFEIPADGGG